MVVAQYDVVHGVRALRVPNFINGGFRKVSGARLGFGLRFALA